MKPSAFGFLNDAIVQSTLVATATVLFYDFLCTLDQEIAYVWSNPWSISSVLFFCNRYLPFVDTCLTLTLKFSNALSNRCLMYHSIITWLIVIGTLISEIILMLRTYAIWERKRSILISLCFLGFFASVPAIIVTHIELRSFQYAPPPAVGCRLVHASPIILFAYLLLVTLETIMAILTIIKAYPHFRYCQSGWVLQLYREGVLFYFYLLAISLANIIVPLTAPSVFANWLAMPQRVIHSILCNRVLFTIFRQRSASSMTNRAIPDSSRSLQVYDSVVENEGETNMNMTIRMPSMVMGESIIDMTEV